jgi:hypothetical protein
MFLGKTRNHSGNTFSVPLFFPPTLTHLYLAYNVSSTASIRQHVSCIDKSDKQKRERYTKLTVHPLLPGVSKDELDSITGPVSRHRWLREWNLYFVAYAL